MKRFHLNMGVADLDRSIRFYTTFFGAEPTVREADYAKWMLDDPRINFAISNRNGSRGIDHVGIQVDAPEELEAITARLEQAGDDVLQQEATVCCYARSDKTWVRDPEGVSWETFRSLGRETVYGAGPDSAESAEVAVSDTDEQPVTARCC